MIQSYFWWQESQLKRHNFYLMERADEINETINEDIGNSQEPLHLKGKENESSQQQDNCNLMESTSFFISPVNDWHEHASMLRSPELSTDNLKDKDLISQTGSLCGSDVLRINVHDVSNNNIIAEELTLNDYKHQNMSLPSSSKSEDEIKGNTGAWQNFYKLVGGPRDAVEKDPGSLGNEIDVRNFFLNHLGDRKFPVQKHPDPTNANSIQHSPGIENHAILGDIPTVFPYIRTKILPASGFPQFMVKNSLKGKGVAHKHPGSYGPPGISEKSPYVERNPKGPTEVLPNVFNEISARTDNAPCLYEGGASVALSNSDGINLRYWLRPGKHIVNKAERHYIFKQVLELVDSSHAKGFALQHLRPSYFMVLPLNQIKYIGSFVSGTPMEPIGSLATDFHCLRRKRRLDQNNESSELLRSKHHKYNRDVKVNGASALIGAQDGMEAESSKGCRVEIARNQTGLDSWGQSYGECYQSASVSGGGNVTHNAASEIMQLEERWYVSPEELNGSGCPFTSNIYSLGVLFFEFFCCFESSEVHSAAMLDLGERVLPSTFLSESSKEAGFCLWLLHPDPFARPKCRKVLLSDIIRGAHNVIYSDQLSVSFDEEDSEAELLQHFLLTLKEKKERQAEKLVEGISCLRKDVAEVVKRHMSRVEHHSYGVTSVNNVSDNNLDKESSCVKISSISVSSMNEERLMRNIIQLENAYFSMRSEIEISRTNSMERTDKDVLRNQVKVSSIQTGDNELCTNNNSDRLGAFFNGLCKYARYNNFEVRGTLRNGDALNSANVICSLSFDRDEEYFAAAGVAKKIKIYEYASLLNDSIDIHYPVVEMSSKSRLSCVCWNSYIKNYLASTDYDGAIQLWDASTGRVFYQYAEHQARAWSVDFSQVDPTKFASGSDDCTVKLWSINEKNCTNTIRNAANVCCVQFSAHSTHLLAFGSADYKIHCYDLRHARVPWCTLAGHQKAVSYVKFLDSETLVSASTDNTLKLWNLNNTSCNELSTNACSLTFSGHTNEKNFVGLSVSNGYIACGSETNEVYAYYKSLPMPITSHIFGSIDPISGQEISDDKGQFVSSVCWRERSDMVVAANSSGCIKLLQMV